MPNRACIHKSHRTVANKGTLLNRHRSTPCSYTPRPSAQGAGKNPYLPDYARKGPNYTLPQLPSEGSASNQPASRCWLWSSPLGHWPVLTHPQLPRSTKNQEGSLDCYKGLRCNQKLGLGWSIKFISCMRPRCQAWERWLFYLMHRQSRKMKKQWTIFQTKDQDKTPEIDLNEMEISDLPESSK